MNKNCSQISKCAGTMFLVKHLKVTVVFLNPKVDHMFYLLCVSTVEILNPHSQQIAFTL